MTHVDAQLLPDSAPVVTRTTDPTAPRALRVLMIEDCATDAKLVAGALRQTGRTLALERVETAEAMRAALEREWDIVVSDWSMPKFSAPAALRILKEMRIDIPFIIVSGTIGEEAAVEAMRAGAHDFLLKDKLARLAPAVERELRECIDRAARRQAEGALRESEARFGRLAESGIIGIVTADVHGNILDANDAYTKMVGYSREDLVQGALRWADLTAPELRHLTLQFIEKLQSTGIAAPFETESLRKDGTRIPILVGAAMLAYPKFIAFAADLTERRRAEDGRIRAEKALYESERQLRQAQKMEALGRLAGGVAHDFNNVLSVILSYGELILSGMKPLDPLRADIEEIRSAARRAAGLTRQLLLLSRQKVAAPKVVEIHDVLTSMKKMIARILGEDVELVIVTPKSSGRVKIDPSHIDQVILNLVVNARDAMPTGGKLTIETDSVLLDEEYARNHLRAKAGPYVMVAVSDTGTGMDRETQARIFEPFFTTKEIGKGTGLGLSTVFGIVQQCGGHLFVYSEPGQGTTFKVYLPQVDAAVDVLQARASPATLYGTETILLVEDEEQVRKIAQNILRRQGYRVIAAPHGEEALRLSAEHQGPIALLLTDVVMPKMSGPELAKRLMAARPETKVLCMSGYTDDSIVRHGVLESGVAFIQKPFTPSSLATKIREVLDQLNSSKIKLESP
jgi:two-component system cell cycle sensor histidine kinase/response regulator CckA